jgi:RND family efflux transporter MFP subunit
MKNKIIFILILALTACSDKKTEETIKAANILSTVYQTALVEKSGITTSIKLPGQLAAFQEVSIFPKVNGYVKNVWVDIGHSVKKGELLMTLEAPELLQAVLQAKEKYAKAKSELAIDKEYYLRLIDASKTPGAISPFDLSSKKAKVESDSVLCNAEKANWEMQQALMDYLKVTAPFAGIITERNVHPGALVNASSKDKPMLELKQIDHLRLLIDVAETMASQLKEKDSITFSVNAFPGKKMYGLISRKSENINSQYRSERIEVDVWNNQLLLSPGMYADVIITAKGNIDAYNVPKSSIINSTEKKYVIVIRNGNKIKVDVITGNETKDKTEVFGSLQVRDSVIINASDEIK